MKDSIEMHFLITSMRSYALRDLDFLLWNDLKLDLPKDYLITMADMNLLIILNTFCSHSKKKTMSNILQRFDKLDKTERNALYKRHCDPYELFIDAWRINTSCQIILKD